MYLRDLVGSLTRRWYLAVVGVLLVAGLGWLTFGWVSPTYGARANVLLLPPQSSLEPGDNPFLGLGGLGQPLEVLARLLDSDATRSDLLEDFPGADYVVAEDSSTNSPILLVESQASTPEAALGTLEAVLASVPATLGELQDKLEVPPDAQVTSTDLTVDAEASPDSGSQMRAVLAAVALGGTTVVLAVGMIDGVLLARRKPAEVEGDDALLRAPTDREPTRRRGRRRRPSPPDETDSRSEAEAEGPPQFRDVGRTT